MSMSADLHELTRKILEFRDARNWKQFHNPKDMALSLTLEAAELLEHFQWKNGQELDRHVSENRMAIGEELADVLYWVLLMSKDINVDIVGAFENKMKKNAEKYPIEKARNSKEKYSEL